MRRDAALTASRVSVSESAYQSPRQIGTGRWAETISLGHRLGHQVHSKAPSLVAPHADKMVSSHD